MKKSILTIMMLSAAGLTLHSCLDYDEPGSELSVDQSQGDATKYQGDIDKIDYMQVPVEEDVNQAIDELQSQSILGYSLSAQYALRGGKENGMPGAHAYQYQYNLGPDNYAGYFVVSHSDFPYANGTLTSTYNLTDVFNGGPRGNYTLVKNSLMPLLHHPAIDKLPEVKAINLLYYCVAAQEVADISGPFTYLEDKMDLESPTTYNDLQTIYEGIVSNLDTIVACLKHFKEQPEWYQSTLLNYVLMDYQTGRGGLTGDYANLIESYWRLANSLKLRMGMRIVKVDPATARKWAEEAVASGVYEAAPIDVEVFKPYARLAEDENATLTSAEEAAITNAKALMEKSESMEHAMYPAVSGFTNPLVEIAGSWGDTRLNASFESVLASLGHPYMTYLWKKNSETINSVPAGDRVMGIRAGTFVEQGQTFATNRYIGYSTFVPEVMANAPLYFVKLSEVLFLQAEGALRGWNMGGDAKTFYEQGIIYACLDEPSDRQWYEMDGVPERDYTRYLYEYMNRTSPIEYTQIDAIDSTPWPSLTKIGVKWDDADSQEVKLEKIITQKYISLFPLSTEAWAELRRTGYPKLFPVLNPDEGDGTLDYGDIIRRVPWIPTDPEAQQNVQETGLDALGGDDFQATRLWWDVDAPNF